MNEYRNLDIIFLREDKDNFRIRYDDYKDFYACFR